MVVFPLPRLMDPDGDIKKNWGATVPLELFSNAAKKF